MIEIQGILIRPDMNSNTSLPDESMVPLLDEFAKTVLHAMITAPIGKITTRLEDGRYVTSTADNMVEASYIIAVMMLKERYQYLPVKPESSQ